MTTEAVTHYLPPELARVQPDPMTEGFWENCRRHVLSVQRCTNCGTFRMPPVPFCHTCRHQDVEWVELSGRGTVFTFVITRRALIPQLEDAVPNVVAVIDLEGAPGCRLVSNVLEVDPEAVEIGLPVVVAWDDVNETVTIPRFVPDESRS